MTPIIKLPVTYQSQIDNASGEGWRECFSSSCAMLAIFYRRVKNDDEFSLARQRHGDSTEARAQVLTLKELGLKVSFITTGKRADIAHEIFSGRPVAVGWLHKGRPSYPRGGGHWSVVVGINGPTGVFMHDPYGEADLVNGGFLPNLDGAFQPYSWKYWGPRWEVEGPGSGWLLTCRE